MGKEKEYGKLQVQIECTIFLSHVHAGGQVLTCSYDHAAYSCPVYNQAIVEISLQKTHPAVKCNQANDF